MKPFILLAAIAAPIAPAAMHAVLVAPALAQATSVDPAQQQFVFAYRLFQRGENKLAAQAFDEFIGKFPRDERRGDAMYYRAVLAQRAGDHAQAAKLLADAPPTKLVPSYAPLLLQGQAHQALGQHDQALAALERIQAEDLDPSVKASIAYLRGITYRAAGNPEGALQSLRQAAGADTPVRPRALLELARVQAQSGQAAEAIESLRPIAGSADREVAAEAGRLAGDLAYGLGQHAQALEFYRGVIANHQASPQFGPAVLGSLWTHLAAKEYRELLKAVDTYREALSPEHRPTAYYLAGSALQELGQHEKAAQFFAAVPAGPAHAAVYDKALFKMASSQFELGQYDAMAQTIARLRTGVPDSPLQADAEFLLAAADTKRGDPARGAARLAEIINAGPRHPYYGQALVQRARLYQRNNQLAAAAADYQRYLDFARGGGGAAAPDEAAVADAALGLIDVQTQLNKPEEALTAADALLARDAPPLAEQEAMYRRALALVRLNRPDEALAAIDQLLAEHPQNAFLPEARYYRGVLLTSLNRAAEAVEDLRAAAAATTLPEATRINALRLAAMQLRTANDPGAAAAMAELEKLAGPQRLRADELLWLAKQALAGGDTKAALAYVAPLLDEKSQTPRERRGDAMLIAARAQRQAGATDAAIDLYGRVRAMGHQGFQAQLELAQTLRDAGRLDEALAEYAALGGAESSAVAAQSLYDQAMIHREFARQHASAGETATAKQELEQAYLPLKRLTVLYAFPQLSPLPELAYIAVAEVAQERGAAAEAEAALKELAEKFAGGPYASYAQALLLARQNKKGDAAALLRQLQGQSLDPRLAERVTRELRSLEASR